MYGYSQTAQGRLDRALGQDADDGPLIQSQHQGSIKENDRPPPSPVTAPNYWFWLLFFLVGGAMGAVLYKFVVVETAKDESNIDAAHQTSLTPHALGVIGYHSPASTLQSESGFDQDTYTTVVEENISTPLNMSSYFTPYSFTYYGYFSATDENRAADLMSLFSNHSIELIIGNRGGWGCARVLELLDYDLISQAGTVMMGYSDYTALLNAITHKTGRVTIHGPMGVDNWTPDSSLDGLSNVKYVTEMLFENQLLTFSNPATFPYTTVTSGKGKGRLIGGNLATFTAIIPSYFVQADFTGKILFLEEVGEAPYRIDRWLTQLALAGVFDEISGFVFGQCTSCGTNNYTDPSDPYAFTWKQVLTMRLSQYPSVPSFYGGMFGHGINTQWTLPVGGMVELDADAGTITMLEPATGSDQAS